MNSPKLPVNFSEELSTSPYAIEFNYDNLDSMTRIVVQQRTDEIKSLLRRTAQDIINIGQKLVEVKQELGHGHFLAWLRTEFDWSESAARKFMQVSRQFKTVKFTDLNIATSALYLLSADSTSEAAREEALERARTGEVITRAKAKAIAQQYQQLDQLQDAVVIDVEAENLSASKVADQPSVPSSPDCYSELSDRLHLLDEAQIATLWQSLSQRLSTKHLTLHNWSKDKLERLVAQAQQVLSDL